MESSEDRHNWDAADITLYSLSVNFGFDLSTIARY